MHTTDILLYVNVYVTANAKFFISPPRCVINIYSLIPVSSVITCLSK